jgi:hypothetical protein
MRIAWRHFLLNTSSRSWPFLVCGFEWAMGDVDLTMFSRDPRLTSTTGRGRRRRDLATDGVWAGEVCEPREISHAEASCGSVCNSQTSAPTNLDVFVWKDVVMSGEVGTDFEAQTPQPTVDVSSTALLYVAHNP